MITSAWSRRCFPHTVNDGPIWCLRSVGLSILDEASDVAWSAPHGVYSPASAFNLLLLTESIKPTPSQTARSHAATETLIEVYALFMVRSQLINCLSRPGNPIITCAWTTERGSVYILYPTTSNSISCIDNSTKAKLKVWINVLVKPTSRV